VLSLLNNRRDCLFWSLNWCALIAWIVPVAFMMRGFVSKIQAPRVILPGWTNLFWLSWLFGAGVARSLYIALSFIWPMQHKGEVGDEYYFGTFTEIASLDGLGTDGSRLGLTQQRGEKLVSSATTAV
jgi:hypothetical protein